MSRRAGIAMALLVLSLPLVSWAVVGDRSRPGDPDDLDFLVRSPELSGLQQLAVAVASGAVALGAARSLGDAWRAGQVGPRARGPVIVLLLLAVAAGVAVRIITAGVIGANIGGGALLLASPVAAIAAVGCAVAIVRAGPPPAAAQPGTATARV